VDGFSINWKRGWRTKDLEVEDSLKSGIDGRFLLDVKDLDGVISTLSNGCKNSQCKGGGLFAKRKGMFNPLTIVHRSTAYHRITANKVIEHGGSNTFLGDGGLHSNVRTDFADTAKGIKRKTNVIE
jgi:hypothetical protein